jgi:hypothetical protein
MVFIGFPSEFLCARTAGAVTRMLSWITRGSIDHDGEQGAWVDRLDDHGLSGPARAGRLVR